MTDKEENTKIQSVTNFEGKVLRGVVDSINLIKVLNPSEKKAEIVQGNDYKEMLELYKQLHGKDYFNKVWPELVAGPVIDADGNLIHAQYTTKQNLANTMLKRRQCNKTKIAREVIMQIKQELGIPLTLVELKAVENHNICKLIVENGGLFKQFQEWMKKYKVERDLNVPNLKKFEWVGPAFCDGIIVPKLPLFKSNDQYQAFLQKYGKLQIQKICDAANPDCLYVRLLDSANQFTEELIEGLNNINQELSTAM